MMIIFQLTTNVICKLMLIFAVVKLREQAPTSVVYFYKY